MTRTIHLSFLFLAFLICGNGMAQELPDSTKKTHPYKNIIRYNISGPLLFGLTDFVILGYERTTGRHQSFSVNLGRITLPNVVSLDLDSFNIKKNQKRGGVNFSVDYRFYLPWENKHTIPHGLYIGPFYSYNGFRGETEWTHKKDQGNTSLSTDTKFNIHTIGFEMGYQFVLGKRLTLDVLVVGPGFGFYNLHAKVSRHVDDETKRQLFKGIEELVTEKFPGMNFVFSDEEIETDGTMRTSTWGYRYLVHIGFRF
jgi:hypothetical protein